MLNLKEKKASHPKNDFIKGIEDAYTEVVNKILLSEWASFLMIKNPPSFTIIGLLLYIFF